MAGKRLKSAKAQVDRLHLYQPLEAFRLLKSFEGAKFDEAVEVHFRLGLNVRHADEQLRGTLMLPHGTGKEALNLEKGSAEPNREKVGRLRKEQVRQIAETKMPDLNARDIEAAMLVVAGTARSLGVEVEL